ncbi:MAG: polyprenyl synthetase family protein [Bacteroides sp.]
MYTVPQLSERINTFITEHPFLRTPEGLYAPVDYVLSMGGKRIRPLLMLMSYNLYRDDLSPIMNQAMGIEVYHNYTLLHDDLMDRADMRRGKETVHKVWNDNTAVLSGDAMLVLAYQLMADAPASCLKRVLATFGQTALEICEGQQFDMEFEQRKDVTEQEYMEMIRLKTSVLLAASLKIGALMAGAPAADEQNLYDLGINLGLAFQLKDDLLDVYGDPKVFGKNIGGDILCNKKTYMLIRAFERAEGEQLRRLNGWVDATSYDPQAKIQAVTALYDALDIKSLCEQKIAYYSRQALLCLERVGVSAERKEELKRLMEQLMYRQS